MGGSASLSPENRRAARARPSRICETAMEKRMETAEAKASQQAARERKGAAACAGPGAGGRDSGGVAVMGKFQYGRWARGPGIAIGVASA